MPRRPPQGKPSRIVCLSAEAVEILYALGCGDRIVGVTAFAREPSAARLKPRVSGFSTVNYRKLEALAPDLVITFSDVQAEAATELIRRGYPVMATNQRSLQQICDTIELLGRVVGRPLEGRRLAAWFRSQLNSVAGKRGNGASRLRIYFEEWDDPLIAGVGWVGELIELAGACDIFADLRNCLAASDRIVQSKDVVRRRPDIIVASWCGKKATLETIQKRPGWDSIPAVRKNQIYEIPSSDILQPGPALVRGLSQLCRIINACRSEPR